MSEPVFRYGEAGDHTRIADAIQTAYGSGMDWRRELQKLTGDPTYRPHRWALGLIDERVVSAGLLMPRRAAIGDAVLRAGLVGYVATVPEERRKGYGSRVMRMLTELLNKEEFDYGYLSASPEGLLLYGYMGWQVFLEDVFAELPLGEAVAMAPPGRAYDVVPISETSTDDLCALYDAYARQTPGAILRTPEEYAWLVDFKLHIGHIDRGLSFAAMLNDRLCGYVIGRQGNFHTPVPGLYTITEAIHATGSLDAYRAILDALSPQAKLRGYERLRIGLHSEHPLMVWAQRGRAQRAHDPMHDMATIPDLGRFLVSMGPELHRRLQAGGLQAPIGLGNLETSLQVRTPQRSATIGLRQGSVWLTDPDLKPAHQISLQEQDLAPWLFGTIPLRALVATERAQVSSAQALQIASVLFPRVELWQSHLDC